MIHESDNGVGKLHPLGRAAHLIWRVPAQSFGQSPPAEPWSQRILRPGGVDGMQTFAVSLVAMLAILVVDLMAGDTIRLQVLYVFPLTAIGLHTERRWALLLGLAVAVTCQCLTIAIQDVPVAARVVNGLIAIAATLLVARLAGSLRAHYLVTTQSAATDALTGLLNRRTFDEMLALEISVQRRQSGTLGVVVIDLDGFKALNDSAGHRAGDDALRIAADTLRGCTRGSDAVARIGGDEFAILLRGATPEGCRILSRKLVGATAVAMREHGYAVTASVGCHVFTTPPASPEAAVEAADRAMYEAKASGKCTFACH